MKSNISTILTCLLILCAILSCSSDENTLIINPDGKVKPDDVKHVLNDVSIEWGRSREALINEMSGYNLVPGTEDEMLQFTMSENGQIISYQLKDGQLCGSIVLLPVDTLAFDILSVLKGYKYIGELTGARIYENVASNTLASVWEPVESNSSYCAIGFAPIKSDAYEDIEPIIITASNAVNITAEKAEIGGTITGYNGNVTCGVLYSINSDMTSAAKKTKKASGNFSFEITGLNNNTIYYYQAFATIDDITYYSNVESFKTEFIQTYDIGDWYPDYNNREGVVFYTSSNGAHGKIVSLERNYLYWDTETLFAKSRGCTSTTDGMSNTNMMPRSSSQTLAGPWCLDYGQGWYCPARSELVTLAKNINSVNTTLTSKGYQEMGAHYWSSTESSSDKAYIVTLGVMSSSDYVGKYFAVSKGQNYGVCAIKQF